MANIVIPYDQKINKNGSSTYYVVDFSKLMAIQKYLMTADFLRDIKLLFNDANQYVVSCRLYPFNITRFTTLGTKNVVVGNGINIKDSDNNNISSYYINTKNWGRKKIATINFNEYFNSFLDYEPYTKIQIYLPYCDFIDIDVNFYMNKKLEIYFEVDFSTGNCMYLFVVDNDMIESHNGKIGIDIPLSQANGAEIGRNNLLNLLNMSRHTIGIASDYAYKSGLKSTSKNINTYVESTMIQTGIGSVVDFINSNQKKFQKSSQQNGFLDFTKPQKIYMIISRPNVVIPSNYAHTIGIPSGKTSYLWQLNGFTIVDEIHLSDFQHATSDEVNEIEQLLKSGVIL